MDAEGTNVSFYVRFKKEEKKCQAQCSVSNGRLPVVHGCLSSPCPQCAVQVKLELGHRAQVRKKPTVEGFTHDWMVFVRGPEHSNIQHFVEKVVFHLHESFPRPKRGRARIQKELDKKCLCSRRKQSLGPGGPPAPLPAPRVALAGVASGPGCAAPRWPGLGSRPRARHFGFGKVTAEKGPSGVECLFIPSQPSPVLWG